MDDKILSLYARGMTTRDIVDSFKEMYNADISPTLISKVTNAVIEDILIACVDGLKGFPDAINTVQLCTVHMIRNSLRFASRKDYKAVTTDLKRIYKADTEDIALIDLDAFSEKWDDKYPQISKSWISNWENLNTFFRYPKDIRKTIYTTNAIESLNSVFRKAIKNRKVFPNDDSAKKVIYIAIRAASKKWSKPNHNWRAAMNRFIIEFEDRLKKHL